MGVFPNLLPEAERSTARTGLCRLPVALDSSRDSLGPGWVATKEQHVKIRLIGDQSLKNPWKYVGTLLVVGGDHICHGKVWNNISCRWLVSHLRYSHDYVRTVCYDKKPISNDFGESLGLMWSAVEAIRSLVVTLVDNLEMDLSILRWMQGSQALMIDPKARSPTTALSGRNRGHVY